MAHRLGTILYEASLDDGGLGERPFHYLSLIMLVGICIVAAVSRLGEPTGAMPMMSTEDNAKIEMATLSRGEVQLAALTGAHQGSVAL